MCPSDYDSTDYANHSNMILQNDDYFVDFKVEVEFIMMIIVISWHFYAIIHAFKNLFFGW